MRNSKLRTTVLVGVSTLAILASLSGCQGETTAVTESSQAIASPSNVETEKKDFTTEKKIMALFEEMGYTDLTYTNKVMTYRYTRTNEYEYNKEDGAEEDGMKLLDEQPEIESTFDNVNFIFKQSYDKDGKHYDYYMNAVGELLYVDGVKADLIETDYYPFDDTMYALIPDIYTSCDWAISGYGNYEHSLVETDTGYTITKKGSNITVTLNLDKDKWITDLSAEIGHTKFVAEFDKLSDTPIEVPEEVKALEDEMLDRVAKANGETRESTEADQQ